MKRKFIFVLGILLFFCIVAVNCSAQSSINDQRIVGTWVCSKGSDLITFVFNANGSGSITEGGGTDTFTYGISLTGEIKIVYSGGSRRNVTLYFSPDGRTLILESDFFRKK